MERDRLIIRDIEFIGHCGLTEEERTVGQRISADVEISFDISRAAASDRIEETINYVEVCKRVVSIGKSSGCHLLETLADKMAEEIINSYSVSEITLRLRKCSVPIEFIKGSFEVEITRKKRSVSTD